MFLQLIFVFTVLFGGNSGSDDTIDTDGLKEDEHPHNNHYPFYVTIIGSVNGKYESLGHGTIVSKINVITSATSVTANQNWLYASKIAVISGNNYRNIDEHHIQRHSVASIQRLDQFKHPAYGYDISVLNLKDPIEFDEYRQPLRTCDTNENQTGFDMMAIVVEPPYVARPGYKVKVKHIKLKEVAESHCRNIFNDQQEDEKPPRGSQICHDDKKSDTCDSDKGGPLVLFDSKAEWTKCLYGVNSWNFFGTCRDPKWPTAATRVSYYIDNFTISTDGGAESCGTYPMEKIIRNVYFESEPINLECDTSGSTDDSFRWDYAWFRDTEKSAEEERPPTFTPLYVDGAYVESNRWNHPIAKRLGSRENSRLNVSKNHTRKTDRISGLYCCQTYSNFVYHVSKVYAVWVVEDDSRAKLKCQMGHGGQEGTLEGRRINCQCWPLGPESWIPYVICNIDWHVPDSAQNVGGYNILYRSFDATADLNGAEVQCALNFSEADRTKVFKSNIINLIVLTTAASTATVVEDNNDTGVFVEDIEKVNSDTVMGNTEAVEDTGALPKIVDAGRIMHPSPVLYISLISTALLFNF